ncbi:restriction endonuclease subunit S [Nostoc sp.]|uniref:restriction endonuclease subunit S n=1 Tax=Nostoc sp. TaxID=1180 RepID=UPI002FF787A5
MAPQFIQLKELGHISQGITLSRYANDQGETYRVVSVSDLEQLYVEDVQGQTQLAVPDIQRYELLENDVVIAIRGTILKSSVVTASLQGSVSNQNTVFFRSQSKKVNPLYLAVLLRSEYFEKLPSFRERQSTTTLPAIRVTDLRNLEIPLPDLHTQDQIAQLFLSIEQAKKITLSAIETRYRLSKVALFKALEM